MHSDSRGPKGTNKRDQIKNTPRCNLNRMKKTRDREGIMKATRSMKEISYKGESLDSQQFYQMIP